MVLTSFRVGTSMMKALLARVPPVTTYRPSGDIITMCGLTLFPRNTLPIILWVLMSIKAMSFESRLTIMTTEVGSVILMSWASNVAAHAKQRANTSLATNRTLNILLLLNRLNAKTQLANARQAPENRPCRLPAASPGHALGGMKASASL